MKAQRILSNVLIAVYIFLIIIFVVEHWQIKNLDRHGIYDDFADADDDDEDNCTWTIPCVNMCPSDKNHLNEEIKKEITLFVRTDNYYKVSLTFLWNEPECHFFESKVITNENKTIRVIRVS